MHFRSCNNFCNPALRAKRQTLVNSCGEFLDLQQCVFTNSSGPGRLKKGYNQESEPETLYPDEDGRCTVEIREPERVVIYLEDLEIQSDCQSTGCPGIQKKERICDSGEYKIRPYKGYPGEGRGEPRCYGYLVNGDVLKPLPIGSTFDTGIRVFLEKTPGRKIKNAVRIL